MSFVDSDHGFLADNGGVVYRTEDGGKTWARRGSILEAPQSLDFIDEQVGIAGVTGAAMLTKDGGQTWKLITPVLRPSVAAVGGSLWAYCGSAFCRGEIAASRDRGITWTVVLAEAVDPGLVVSVGSTRALVVSGRGPRLRYTDDHGAHWHEMSDPCPENWHIAASGSSRSDAWLACGGEPATIQQLKRVYRSDDGGRRWRLVARVAYPKRRNAIGSLPIDGHINGGRQLLALDQRHALLVLGRTGLYVTSDGGVTWRAPIANDLDGQVGVPEAVDKRHAWFISEQTVWRTIDGRTWQPLPFRPRAIGGSAEPPM